MAGDYIKCPRCELNYIHKDDEFCEVCKAELKLGPKLLFSDDEIEEYEDMELCPVCKQNPLKDGEDVCEKCSEEAFEKDELDLDKDEEWRTFLDDKEAVAPVEEDEMLSLNELQEEEMFSGDEEEEELFPEPDDFDESFEDDFDEEYDDDDEDEEEDFDD